MKIQLFTDNESEGSLFEKCLDNYSLLKIEDEPSAEADLIILNISALKNERSKRLGISFLQKIRRDYFISAPIITYSFESFESLAADFPILQTKGVSFLRLPFSSEDLISHVNESQDNLTQSELIEIVRLNCSLKEEWRMISHRIGGYLSDYVRHKNQIENLINEWTKSINCFAPEQRTNLEEFQDLLNLPVESVDINRLKSAVQKLDESLQGKVPNPADDFIENNMLPKCPPKGFSKVMIADDEPLDSLIFDLREYNYEFVGQAKGIKEAKRQLIDKQPTVVLSDFYFKSSEYDKTTDKKFGIEFMEFAQSFNVGSKSVPENPIVAVISKTSLDPLEIPSGVLDCSGTRNATNPEFIHGAIWTEARRRGIKEPETIHTQEWKLEHYCRQKLEPYQSELPKIIRQWELFSETVKETLLMLQSIPESDNADEMAIIRKIINALQPYKDVTDFSFEQVYDIFLEVEESHQAAKNPPNSEVKDLIRNILHGKIEQFAAVTNHIDSARKSFAEISSRLISLPQFNDMGIRIKKALDDFSEKESLIPFLCSLKNDTDFALEKLPELPKRKGNVRPKEAVKKKINVIVVEDNRFYAQIVLSAIEKVKSRLGANFEISVNDFDNAEDGLKAIPQINKMPLKAVAQDATKTIAIVDICLPANNKELNQIPDMKHGINLLKNLSDYNVSVPTIVFSTKSSIENRRDIGKLGISDENFISKESLDPEPAIVQSLIALVEKKQKYFIRRHERHKKATAYYAFSINGICIPLSNELNATFQALFELLDESNRANKTQFSAEDIYIRKLQNSEKKLVGFSEREKKTIQSHINKIREFIYNTFRQNSRYIDVRDLIKTVFKETEEYCYELNAELPSLEDEENFEEDYEIFRNRKYNILVIEENQEHRGQIVSALKSISNTVKCISSLDRNFTQTILDFRPDIICIDLQQAGCWKTVKSIFPNERLGIIVTTTDKEPNNDILLETALESAIPSTNFVSTNKDTWINSLLTKLDNEKRRVFLGEVVDCEQNLAEVNEPIVEVLTESDLSNGILKLRINGDFFTMNKSNISKIIGYLLQNPKILIPLETIKKEAAGSSEPVTKDDQTGWTKKIRNKIQNEWLKTDDRKRTMEILVSSEKGMKLNVQVIHHKANR